MSREGNKEPEGAAVGGQDPAVVQTLDMAQAGPDSSVKPAFFLELSDLPIDIEDTRRGQPPVYTLRASCWRLSDSFAAANSVTQHAALPMGTW